MRRILVLLTLGTLSCGDDTGPPDARRIDAEPEPGTVSLTWSIEDTGTAVSCSTIGAGSLTLAIVPVDQPFGITDTITCSAGEGTSRGLAPDTYNITASLAGVTAPAILYNNVIVVSGEDTPLGNAAFEVDASGGFSFRIVAGSGGNCVALGSGGAGITTVSIALTDGAATCVPVTFDIAAGAGTAAGTYTTDCATPAAFPTCIAEDQTISVAPTLASGSHRMTIVGLNGAESCWTRNPQFNVPAGGVTANLPQQNLVVDMTNPACTN